jgi:hypothetical protein
MSDDTNSTINNNNEQHSVFSEQDKELANKAKQEYEGGQFDGLFEIYFIQYFEILFCIVCLKTLQKLLESHPDDPKVLFNLALTEYALSSFQRTDLFKSQLNKIAEKVMFFF